MLMVTMKIQKELDGWQIILGKNSRIRGVRRESWQCSAMNINVDAFVARKRCVKRQGRSMWTFEGLKWLNTTFAWKKKKRKKNFGPNWGLSRPAASNSSHQGKRTSRKIWKQNVSFNRKSKAWDLRVEAYWILPLINFMWPSTVLIPQWSGLVRSHLVGNQWEGDWWGSRDKQHEFRSEKKERVGMVGSQKT